MSWFFPIVVWLFLILDFVAYICVPIKIRTSHWIYKLPGGGVTVFFQYAWKIARTPNN